MLPAGSSGGKYRSSLSTSARVLSQLSRNASLQIGDHGPLDLKVRVAPVVGRLGVTEPLVRDADAADEADFAIDDQ